MAISLSRLADGSWHAQPVSAQPIPVQPIDEEKSRSVAAILACSWEFGDGDFVPDDNRLARALYRFTLMIEPVCEEWGVDDYEYRLVLDTMQEGLARAIQDALRGGHIDEAKRNADFLWTTTNWAGFAEIPFCDLLAHGDANIDAEMEA